MNEQKITSLTTRFHLGRALSCVALSMATACTPALPQQSFSKQVGDRALMAGSSAKAADEAAARAEEKLAESRRLYEQAVKMLEEARNAQAYCAEVKKKIPKQRVVYIEKKHEATDENSEEEKPKEPEGPKYSPSDAPATTE